MEDYEFLLFSYDLPLVAKKKTSCTKEDLHDKSSPKQTDQTFTRIPQNNLFFIILSYSTQNQRNKYAATTTYNVT